MSSASGPPLWRRRGFNFLLLANVLEGACFYGFLALLTLYVPARFALDDVATGRWVGSFLGAVTLLMLPGGALCDRLGPARALRWGLALLAGGRSLLLLGEGPAALAAALFFMAAGSGVVLPTVYAGVRSTLPPERASAGYAWLYGLMNAGVVVWMSLSPGLKADGGIPRVYTVLTWITWINLLLQLGGGQDAFPLAAPERRRSLPSLRLALFLCALFPVRSLLAHLQLTFPTYVKRVHPGLAPELEHCFALHFALQFGGALLLTRAAPGDRPIVVGSALSALAALLLCLPGHADWTVWAFVALFSLGEGWWQTRFYEQVASRAPAGQVGWAMSLANLPWFAAKTSAGFYSGAMLARYAPQGGPDRSEVIWASYAVGALLTPLALWALGSWRGDSADAPRTSVK